MPEVKKFEPRQVAGRVNRKTAEDLRRALRNGVIADRSVPKNTLASAWAKQANPMDPSALAILPSASGILSTNPSAPTVAGSAVGSSTSESMLSSSNVS